MLNGIGSIANQLIKQYNVMLISCQNNIIYNIIYDTHFIAIGRIRFNNNNIYIHCQWKHSILQDNNWINNNTTLHGYIILQYYN